MRRLLVVEFAAVTTLALLAALGWHRVFAGQSFLGPVVGAAVLAAGLSVLAGVWRNLGALTTLALHVVGFTIYTVIAVLSDTSSSGGPGTSILRDLVGGLTGGWADLMTISLPAVAEPRLLVTAAAIVWVSSAGAVELARRSRSLIAPVLPSLLAYTITLMVASGEPQSPVALPTALVAVMMLALLVHANRWASIEPGGLRLRSSGDSPEPSSDVSADRRVLVGLPVIGVAALIALLAATIPASALRTTFDPRSLRNPTFDVRPQLSPLAGVYRQLGEPQTAVFRVEIDRLSASLQVPRVRVATLDRYDGASWTSSAAFARVGSVLPAPPPSDVRRLEITQTYTIEALDGPWLPSADQPAHVRTDDASAELGFDKVSGTLIVDRSDLSDLTYEVTSLIASPTDAQLLAASPGGEGVDSSLSVLPEGVPDIIPELARQLSGTNAASEPYVRLKALEAGLASSYGYTEALAPGSSYGRLERFLGEDRRGYAEQFASSFALMARSLGYPSRLSVGYLTTEIGPDAAPPNADGEISTREAHVWPEVYFDGIGWVGFEPTPARVPTDEAPDVVESEVLARGRDLFEEEPAPVAETPPPADAGEERGGIPRRLLLLALLVGFVLALVGALVLAKFAARRSRRRRATTGAQQVLQAWREVIDRLLELGVPIRRSMTAHEVVDVSAAVLPPTASARLSAMAPVVTAAVFAPSEPHPERVEGMELDLAEFRRESLEGAPIGKRMRAAVSPKPLLYAVGRG